jgi:replicative DNA helicase
MGYQGKTGFDQNVQLNREPPHNIDLEQAMIGAILNENTALDRASFLEGRHFYDALHGQIFDVAKKAISENRLANAWTLRTYFEQHEPIGDSLSVPLYLGQLQAKATTTRNAKHYADAIYIAICNEAIKAVYDGSIDVSPEAQVEHTQSQLDELRRQAPNEQRVMTIGEAASIAEKKIEDAYKREDGLAGLSIGFPSLDKAIGGLVSSELLVLGGRPSMGKTTLGVNIAFNAAQAGHAALIFSLEMSALELALRILSERTGIAVETLRTGRLTQSDFPNLMEQTHALRGMPLHVDQSGGLTLSQIAIRARLMHRKHRLSLIVIDYLKLLGGSNSYRGNRVQEITEITTGLKALAKELGIPIIALSQLSRAVEQREDKRPQLSDLRESGSIEQDADVVLFVYRDEYYIERKRPSVDDFAGYTEWQAKINSARGKAEVIVAKHRHGRVSTVELIFDADTATFRDKGDV